MSATRYQQMKTIVGKLMELETSEWESKILEWCGDDEDLVKMVRNVLENMEQAEKTLHFHPLSATPEIPSHIGPYRLGDKIGEGGMGHVYEGYRDDGQFEQKVALKVMC